MLHVAAFKFLLLLPLLLMLLAALDLEICTASCNSGCF